MFLAVVRSISKSLPSSFSPFRILFPRLWYSFMRSKYANVLNHIVFTSPSSVNSGKIHFCSFPSVHAFFHMFLLYFISEQVQIFVCVSANRVNSSQGDPGPVGQRGDPGLEGPVGREGMKGEKGEPARAQDGIKGQRVSTAVSSFYKREEKR